MPFLTSMPEDPHTSLLQLPIELLIHITTFLPSSAVVALTLTNRALHKTLPHKVPKALRDPAKKTQSFSTKPLGYQEACPLSPTKSSSPPPASLRALNESHCAPPSIRTLLHPTNHSVCYRCPLCKNNLPTSHFSSSTGLHGVPKPAALCFWCAAQLARVIFIPGPPPPTTVPHDFAAVTETNAAAEAETNALAKEQAQPRWYAMRQRMCMHCGGVDIWGGCRCGGCGVCWMREVVVFTRFVVGSWGQQEQRWPSWEFVERKGEWIVRETRERLVVAEDGSGSEILVEEIPVVSV